MSKPCRLSQFEKPASEAGQTAIVNDNSPACALVAEFIDVLFNGASSKELEDLTAILPLPVLTLMAKVLKSLWPYIRDGFPNEFGRIARANMWDEATKYDRIKQITRAIGRSIPEGPTR